MKGRSVTHPWLDVSGSSPLHGLVVQFLREGGGVPGQFAAPIQCSRVKVHLTALSVHRLQKSVFINHCVQWGGGCVCVCVCVFTYKRGFVSVK